MTSKNNDKHENRSINCTEKHRLFLHPLRLQLNKPHNDSNSNPTDAPCNASTTLNKPSLSLFLSLIIVCAVCLGFSIVLLPELLKLEIFTNVIQDATLSVAGVDLTFASLLQIIAIIIFSFSVLRYALNFFLDIDGDTAKRMLILNRIIASCLWFTIPFVLIYEFYKSGPESLDILVLCILFLSLVAYIFLTSMVLKLVIGDLSDFISIVLCYLVSICSVLFFYLLLASTYALSIVVIVLFVIFVIKILLPIIFSFIRLF